MHSSNIIVIIPDIGSKSNVTRKNLRILAGKPLIYYGLALVRKSKYHPRVIVTTGDPEVQSLCTQSDTDWISLPCENTDDHTTLDPIIYNTLLAIEEKDGVVYDIVITLQPTSPLLKVSTLDDAIKSFVKDGVYDSYISAVNRPNLAWIENKSSFQPVFKQRINRKYLPRFLVENGTFVISRRSCITRQSRFGKNVYVFEIDETEGLEILRPKDWLWAENELKKKKVLIRLEGHAEIGLGHVHRGLQIASALFEHDILFVTTRKSFLAKRMIEDTGYSCYLIQDNKDILRLIKKNKIDIVINDVLNTKKKEIIAIKELQCRCINFEDLGDGAKHADVVINALYSKQNDNHNTVWGQEYYCIRDEFIRRKKYRFKDTVEEILITCGGTDPGNIAEKSLNAISMLRGRMDKVHITVILGNSKQRDRISKLIRRNGINATVHYNVSTISDFMSCADIAISSQGRTMYELAYMCVPTILIAQNKREECHTFGSLKNGFINLGLAGKVRTVALSSTIAWLADNPQIRRQMNERMCMLELDKGIYRVKELILGEEDFWK